MPAQFRVYASFFLYALALGSIFSRLSDLQIQMGIGEATLGYSIIGVAVGTQISLFFSGPFIERFGYRLSLMVLIPFLGFAETLATLSQTPIIFFVAMFVAGLAIGATEIIVNLEADRTEHKISRRIMNRAHAFWSLGFFAAGMVGATASQWGINPTTQILGVTIAVGLLTYATFRDFTPAPQRPTEGGEHPKFIAPTKGILVIVACTLSAMLLEGAGIDWSVIFMRNTFDASPFTNGLALSFGALAQALIRFFADPFVDRYGPVRVARIMLITLGIGAVTVTFSLSPLMALIGFALMGVGTSAIFPLAMSAAAQRTDRPAAVNVASLAQLSFVTFLVAPPFLGFIAEHFGIRVSFGIGIPLVILSLLTVKSLAAKAHDKP